MAAVGIASSVIGMSVALVRLSESVATQVTLVVNFPGDCRKLRGVVHTVQFVAESAREQAESQPDTLHEGWPKCLQLLKEAVEEVGALCNKCDGMNWIGRFFRSREMSRSLDCIINRLQLALACVPIQQNQLLAQELHKSVVSVQQDVAVAVQAAEQQLDDLQRQLMAMHRENREGLQHILAVLLFMLQGHPAFNYQCRQQQLHLPQAAASKTPSKPQLTAGASCGDDAMSVLLRELTELRDRQQHVGTGQQQSADGNALAQSIVFVEGLQRQPGQPSLLPYQGSAAVLYPDVPALGQPHAGCSTGSSSSSSSSSGGGGSRSPSPLMPPTPASPYQPAAAVRADSLGSAFSRLLTAVNPSRRRQGATRSTPGWPVAAASTTSDAAGVAAPQTSPGFSLLEMASCSHSCQLPADVQAVLDTAKLLPHSPSDWQALGHAVQMSLWGKAGLTVSLMGQQLTDEQVEALARWSAPFWPMLQQLDLSANCLTGTGAAALAVHAAPHWHRLEVLALDGNGGIGDSGIKALADNAAPLLPQLHTLQLGSTGMGDEGARALSESAVHWPRLTLLGLGHNLITERGLVGFTEVLRQGWWAGLRQLHLEGNAFLVSSSDEVAQLKQAAREVCAMHGVEEMLISL